MQVVKIIRSSVGKKAVVAVSGALLFAWIVLHVLGNATAFAGPGAMDEYAAALRRTGPLLWIERVGLAVTAVAHVYGAASLRARARAARAETYAMHARRGATIASRTMGWGGALLLAFAAYHLLHLTFGVVHPRFRAGHVYDNVVSGLGIPLPAILYVLAAALVGLHVFHGLWAVPRSLGRRERSAALRQRPIVLALATAVALGLAAVPVAALGGFLR